MVDRFPSHLIAAEAGVTALMANIPFGFFNMIFLDRTCLDADDLRGMLTIARRYANACPHPKLLAIATDWLPIGFEAVFEAFDVKPAIAITGMAADRLLPPRRALPVLEYSRVDDIASATEIALINAHAYGMPESDVASISNMAIWIPTNIGVIARLDGRSVATTAAMLLDDCIYIALVATEPDCHKHGFAEAVMREAIRQAIAAFGPRRLWLHATDMGRPVYAAMGFETGSALPAYTFSG